MRLKYALLGDQVPKQSLRWTNLECTLHFRVPGRIFTRGERKTLRVVKPLSDSALPGTLTALMGESGAGKTALLDLLAQRKTFGEIDGHVLVNGVPGVSGQRKILDTEIEISLLSAAQAECLVHNDLATRFTDHFITPTRTLRKRAGAAPWPVWASCPG